MSAEEKRKFSKRQPVASSDVSDKNSSDVYSATTVSASLSPNQDIYGSNLSYQVKMENFEVSTYLADYNRHTSRGNCKACRGRVRWSKQHLASHKRASCAAVSAEEKRMFAIRLLVAPLIISDIYGNNLPCQEEMENFEVSSYLEDYIKHSGRGNCKACLKEVQWSKKHLASHKRVSCAAASLEEKLKFARIQPVPALVDPLDTFGETDGENSSNSNEPLAVGRRSCETDC